MILSENQLPPGSSPGQAFRGHALQRRGAIDHGISAQIAPFTGKKIVDVAVRYMSTACWYQLGGLFA
jgi:hypothetical protein